MKRRFIITYMCDRTHRRRWTDQRTNPTAPCTNAPQSKPVSKVASKPVSKPKPPRSSSIITSRRRASKSLVSSPASPVARASGHDSPAGPCEGIVASDVDGPCISRPSGRVRRMSASMRHTRWKIASMLVGNGCTMSTTVCARSRSSPNGRCGMGARCDHRKSARQCSSESYVTQHTSPECSEQHASWVFPAPCSTTSWTDLI